MLLIAALVWLRGTEVMLHVVDCSVGMVTGDRGCTERDVGDDGGEGESQKGETSRNKANSRQKFPRTKVPPQTFVYPVQK